MNMPGKYLVYHRLNGTNMIHTWYIHGIYQAYCVLIHMDGIYHTKYKWVCSVPFL